jgi:peptidyl-prolyl cis-trans isomerase A (cyclophilin A)
MADMIARMETTMGTMELRLFADKVPNTVQNFVHLSCQGYYDDLIFHRIIKDFMIQGGCPDGRGTGGPDYRFADEFHKDLRHDSRGILSMANSGPNSNGSQFFITLVPTPWLDNRHSVFGELISGEDVLTKIGSAKTGFQDRPVEEIRIIKVTISKDKEILGAEQPAPKTI